VYKRSTLASPECERTSKTIKQLQPHQNPQIQSHSVSDISSALIVLADPGQLAFGMSVKGWPDELSQERIRAVVPAEGPSAGVVKPSVIVGEVAVAGLVSY